MRVQEKLFILTPPLNADDFALGSYDRNGYWPAAHAAIFDVLLLLDRTVNNNLNPLPAIWALNECSFDILHWLPLRTLERGSSCGSYQKL